MDKETELFLNEDKIERTNGTFSSLSTFFKIMPGRLDRFEAYSTNVHSGKKSRLQSRYYRPSPVALVDFYYLPDSVTNSSATVAWVYPNESESQYDFVEIIVVGREDTIILEKRLNQTILEDLPNGMVILNVSYAIR